MPVFGEGGGIFRADDEYNRLTLLKFCKVLAQLRHVGAAEWSDEAAIEDQQDIGLAAEICKTHSLAGEIGQFKIRRGVLRGIWDMRLPFEKFTTETAENTERGEGKRDA